MISFWICSDSEGPSDLKIALRDDGRKYGPGDGARSNDVSLSAYLPKVTKKYQYVSIPLADLILGSGCFPQSIRDIVFVSTGSGHRVYNVDDIGLVVQSGVRLVDAQTSPVDGGKRVRFGVMTVGGQTKSVELSAQVNGHVFPMTPDPARGANAFSAEAAASDVGHGTVAVTFEAKDGGNVSTAIVNAFIPPREPGMIAHYTGAFHADGDLTPFDGVAPFTLSDGPLSLSSRLMFGNKHLYIAIEVKDPDAVAPKFKGDPDQEALLAGGCVEMMITSPAEGFAAPRQAVDEMDRHLVFALGAKDYAWVTAGKHRSRVYGKKTDDGYLIEAEINFDPMLGNGSKACDFDLGRQTRIEFGLRGQGGRQLAWAGSSPADAENPNNWGTAIFTVEPGPPRLRFGGAESHTLTLLSHKPLDPATATDPASYRIEGAKIVAAELSGEGKVVRLTTDRAWNLGRMCRSNFPPSSPAMASHPKPEFNSSSCRAMW
jgi:hypothetical protein